jgi:hypothetical protein
MVTSASCVVREQIAVLRESGVWGWLRPGIVWTIGLALTFSIETIPIAAAPTTSTEGQSCRALALNETGADEIEQQIAGLGATYCRECDCTKDERCQQTCRKCEKS